MPANPTAAQTAEPARRALRRTRIALAIAAAIYGYQLFVPPIVGMTDTGDFHRSLAPAGLAYPRGLDADARRAGFTRHFELVEPRYVNRTGRELDDIYVASEVLLLHLARHVNAVISKRGSFDIVAAGLVHLGVMLAGLALVFSAAGRLLPPRAHLLLLALAVFAFTDVGYAAWFNSLYGEPGSLVFLCLCLGVGLQAAIAARPGPWVAAWFLCAALLATAKAQNIGLVVPLALLGWRLAPRSTPRVGRAALALVVAALLALAPLVYSVTPPRNLRKSGIYQTVFNGLLYSSPDPLADLAALDLPVEHARYVGVDYWADPRSPRLDPQFDATFFSRVGLGTVAVFYLNHPDRLIAMLRTGGTRAFFLRYEYIGNFEAGAGMPPLAQSRAFAIWSDEHRQLPADLLFLTAVLALAAWRMARAARGAATPEARRAAEVLLLLPAVAAVQFATVMIGEGPWTANRQLFLMNAAFDAILVLAPVALAARISRGFASPATPA